MQGQKPGRHLAIALGLALLLSLALAAPGRCQELLLPNLQASANRIFDQTSPEGRLKCTIERENPSLDFTFHFDAGFRISCPVYQFGGQMTRVWILARVTPEGGSPVLLGMSTIFRRSALEPSLLRRTGTSVLFRVSGGFSVGEGRYRVEVALADSHDRICRRSWRIKVPHHWQKAVPVVLAAHQVSPLSIPPWRGPQSKDGLRLAILLSADSYNPGAPRLGAGYQMMLLQILSTLLQEVPCKSVRLVAFNLDQEQVIYTVDSFEPSGFDVLQRAINGLNLGVVSVQTLQKRNEWANMLTTLANQQLTAQPPPDAVIILGRSFRYMKKLPREMLMFRYERMPGFFYFENGPDNLFPDSLGFLIKSLKGKIYRVSTPHDLSTAIEKMLAQVRETGRSGQANLYNLGK